MHGAAEVDAYSAGSKASRRINPKAIESMREVGYDLTTHTSKSLDDIPAVEYDFVATMGCGDACPFVRAKRREDWHIPDPKEMEAKDFRVVRDLIEAKVRALLATL